MKKKDTYVFFSSFQKFLFKNINNMQKLKQKKFFLRKKLRFFSWEKTSFSPINYNKYTLYNTLNKIEKIQSLQAFSSIGFRKTHLIQCFAEKPEYMLNTYSSFQKLKRKQIRENIQKVCGKSSVFSCLTTNSRNSYDKTFSQSIFKNLDSKKKAISVIDWHSTKPVSDNYVGLWFSSWLNPFSTSKYWWILFPSQNFLSSLRWETFGEKSKKSTTIFSSNKSWFFEKPVYFYWIIPFFGCLGLTSTTQWGQTFVEKSLKGLTKGSSSLIEIDNKKTILLKNIFSKNGANQDSSEVLNLKQELYLYTYPKNESKDFYLNSINSFSQLNLLQRKKFELWWNQQTLNNTFEENLQQMAEKEKQLNSSNQYLFLKEKTKKMNSDLSSIVWNDFLLSNSKMNWFWYELNLLFPNNAFLQGNFLTNWNSQQKSKRYIWEKFVGNKNYKITLKKGTLLDASKNRIELTPLQKSTGLFVGKKFFSDNPIKLLGGNITFPKQIAVFPFKSFKNKTVFPEKIDLEANTFLRNKNQLINSIHKKSSGFSTKFKLCSSKNDLWLSKNRIKANSLVMVFNKKAFPQQKLTNNFLSANKKNESFSSQINPFLDSKISQNLQSPETKNLEFYKLFGYLNNSNLVQSTQLSLKEKQGFFSSSFYDYIKSSFIYENITNNLLLKQQLGNLSFSLVNSKLVFYPLSEGFFPMVKKLKNPILMSGYVFQEKRQEENTYECFLTNKINGNFVGFNQKSSHISSSKTNKKMAAKFLFKKLKHTTLSPFDRDFLYKRLLTSTQPVQRLQSQFSKSLNLKNLLFTKDYYLENNFLMHNKQVSSSNSLEQKLNRGLLLFPFKRLSNKNTVFLTKDSELSVENALLQTKKIAEKYRYKDIGNWSFYWNYFKNSYGTSYLLRPFNWISETSRINSINNLKKLTLNFSGKIGLNRIIPGQNILFQKWHSRKKEGFFYKRINKFNLKSDNSSNREKLEFLSLPQILNLSKRKTKNNRIVELLWGFRSKYKLEEVLQYQKSKYYQSKKAQQTNIDSNENQITNDSKVTVQTLTKTLMKHRRYKKYMRFEVLASWLRDVLYFRKMSRRIFPIKKDIYTAKIRNGSLDFITDSYEKLDNQSTIKSLRKKQAFVSSNFYDSALNLTKFEKLNVKFRKNRILNIFSQQERKKSLFTKAYSQKLLLYGLSIFDTKAFPLKQEQDFSKITIKSKKQKHFSTIKDVKNLHLKRMQSSLQNEVGNTLKYFSNIIEPIKAFDNQYLYSSKKASLKKLNLQFSNRRFLYYSNSNKFHKLNLSKYLNFSKNQKHQKTVFINNLILDKFYTIFKELNTKINSLFRMKRLFPNAIMQGAFNIKKGEKSNKILDRFSIHNESLSIVENTKKLSRFSNVYKLFESQKDWQKSMAPFVIDLKNSQKFSSYNTSLKNNIKLKLHNTFYTFSTNIKKFSVYSNSSLKTTRFHLANESINNTKQKIFKTKSQHLLLNSIITEFKNLSSSFVIWRNKFKIRRDYLLLLSYMYLDYVGALINSISTSYFKFPFIQKQNDYEKDFNSSINQMNKYYVYSKTIKKNMVKPKWSFAILNHLKNQHFAVYEQISQFKISETTKEIAKDKQKISSFSPQDNGYIIKYNQTFNPSVTFQRSIAQSFFNNSKLTHLNLENQTKFLPVQDSLFKNKSYLNYTSSICQKKFLFMKKQQIFTEKFGTLLGQNSSNYRFKGVENKKTIKPRRKTGLSRIRILNKKTKIYNGIYNSNPLSFGNLYFSNILNNQYSLNFNQLKITSLWLCTILFHVCLIFSLITVYKSSVHFCVKGLYSTLFVLNKYFVYLKYRTQRLIKYIYQSNFQSIMEYIQTNYYEKYFLSTQAAFINYSYFFFIRNPVFSHFSRTAISTKKTLSFFKPVFFNLKNNQTNQKNETLRWGKAFQFIRQKNQTSISSNLTTGYTDFVNSLKKQKKDLCTPIIEKTSQFPLGENQDALLIQTLMGPENSTEAFNKLRQLFKVNLGDSSVKRNFKLNFKVLQWNMFLTLLIGESEILAELEPYREMHWYFLKRFPIFLRTPSGKDPIGMTDYQADEKIRIIKQKIRQTIMILYLRSRKYESKLQNRSEVSNKKNQSIVKNRLKTAKWAKESMKKGSNTDSLKENIQQAEKESIISSTNLKTDQQNIKQKNFAFKKDLSDYIPSSLKKQKFVLKFIETLKTSKRRQQIRKISAWKSILTFLGKLSFISRYARLNKRFRQSMMLFSYPLTSFGPLGTIFLPYLIKNLFLIFDSVEMQKKFSPKIKTRSTVNEMKPFIYFDNEYSKDSSHIDLRNEYNLFSEFMNTEFSKKPFLTQSHTTPFGKYDDKDEQHQNTSFYIQNRLGNLSFYIKQKISSKTGKILRLPDKIEKNTKTFPKNFRFSGKNSFSQNKKPESLLQFGHFSQLAPDYTPSFLESNKDFLINCQKLVKKYERMYVTLDKVTSFDDKSKGFYSLISKDKNNLNKKSFFLSVFNKDKQSRGVIFEKLNKEASLDANLNLLSNVNIGQLNYSGNESLLLNYSEKFKSRLGESIYFETFDPKLRYYRFYANFTKVLSDVGGLRYHIDAHQHLGSLICQVYTGLFTKQSAKNYLLVAGSNKTDSLLYLVQALAGEMGMKLFMEDAKRLQRIGRRGINKATKRLEKLFDIAQANTPCLVFIEDIHVIGSKTKMVKVDEEQEDEEILVRSLLSKLVYRKYHKNKSLREAFMDQNLYIGGSPNNRRRSLKPINPIPKNLVLYQLTRRSAFANYFSNQSSQFRRINTKLYMNQKLSPAFTTNAVLIWKLFKSKIATPNKRIKEAPWVHIPVDAMRSIHPLTYSIRVKVAKITLLAIFTMGTRLRLVKDLIRLFEKLHYDSHQNFVVFATTNKLSSIDPSLRRPGRLEETIYLSSLTGVPSLVRSSAFMSKLDTFKTYLKELPGLFSTFNVIDNTLFSSRLDLKEWSIINYIAENAYMDKSTDVSNFISKESSDSLEIANENRNKQLILNNFNRSLKKQRMTSFETINSLNGSRSKKNSDYWEILFSNINLQRKKGIFNSIKDHKNILDNQNDTNNESIVLYQRAHYSWGKVFISLAYSQAGQCLISFLPVVSNSLFFFDPDNTSGLDLWSPVVQENVFKSKNILYDRRKKIKNSFIRLFSSKVGEYLFTNPFEWKKLNSKNIAKSDFSIEEKNRAFDFSQQYGFIQSVTGIHQNWTRAFSSVMNVMTTSCLYSKTPLISKLLKIEDVSKPRQKQFFESLNSGMLFEYSDFHSRAFLNKNIVSIEENLNMLQYQKYMLNNQGRPLRKYVQLSLNNRLWLFRILFTELGSLEDISLRPTSMNYYYRNKILNKQKLKLSSYQWWNWHLRKPIDQLEEIQDIAYFPCADKYYNPRHRRWMLTNGYWGYNLSFNKMFYYDLYEQYIFESFHKAYNHLDKNRELIDYLAQLLICKETVTETELFLTLKRFI
uniref:Cell division protein n=1 Tax=Schizomeris leibleinii TaxID=104533 RepID=F8SYD4_9CHLO|nr:cell division protein [Schizomeris leibleinii]AEH05359.1 cell division protein [Schizomeris leibleinii]